MEGIARSRSGLLRRIAVTGDAQKGGVLHIYKSEKKSRNAEESFSISHLKRVAFKGNQLHLSTENMSLTMDLSGKRGEIKRRQWMAVIYPTIIISFH